ncbi:MAG TPA: 3-hydroxyacyl-ACP dehydratase FabZ [Anaeromyxobacteraceae bacterium]|nr:3-hydroxyacyl-ACP dehydratase FabZ [Anaeromyxobacteraceae bacterium]
MSSQQPILDVEGIQRLLPHRPPFLLVDRVVAFEKDASITCLKGVTMNEPFFTGHFPGHPVMPGVLILEALAQAAGLLACLSLPPERVSNTVTYLMGIDGARFRRPVVPGDRLELRCTVTRHKGAVWKQTGQALVDGEVVAEAEFMAMLADKDRGSEPV